MNAPDTAVFARTGCALLCLVALAACERSATQLVPIVRSDLASEQIRCVLAEAGPVRAGAGFEVTDTHVFEIGPDAPRVTIPFSFGLPPPGGERSARVELHVSALSSCEDPSDPDVRTVTRIVRSGFVPQQTIGLPIFLAASCVDVICPETQTCEGGVCVAIPDVDPGTLTPITRAPSSPRTRARATSGRARAMQERARASGRSPRASCRAGVSPPARCSTSPATST